MTLATLHAARPLTALLHLSRPAPWCRAVVAAWLCVAACEDGEDKDDDASTGSGTQQGGTESGGSDGSTGPDGEGGTGSDSSTEDGSTQGATDTSTALTDEDSSEGESDSEGGSDSGGLGEPCDPQVQDCPEGAKCTAVGSTGVRWDTNLCVPVSGSGSAGDPCTMHGGSYSGLDDCGVGFICLFTDEEGAGGVCTAFCENMTCEGGVECSPFNGGVLPVCLLECDPLAQDCPDGLGCYPSAAEGSFVCVRTSADPDAGGKGQECGYAAVNDCQPGLVCGDPGAVDGCPSTPCCTNFCPVSEGSTSCDGEEQCLTIWISAPPPGLEDVGTCRIP